MKIPIYQYDSFTSSRFAGNPAAVCTIDDWLDDATLKNIAAENNLSETAFIVPTDEGYHIRWFTPKTEVPLCGHATLAAAAVVFRELKPGTDHVRFDSMSGPVSVALYKDLLVLNFPTARLEKVAAPGALLRGLHVRPLEVWVADYYMAVLESPEAVAAVAPNFDELSNLDRIGVIVTAQDNQVDFVSRFFGPQLGIPEDPVTGSAHCMLTPYWAGRLGKNRLHAKQISQRRGELTCTHLGDRVTIGGQAVKYMQGTIEV